MTPNAEGRGFSRSAFFSKFSLCASDLPSAKVGACVLNEICAPGAIYSAANLTRFVPDAPRCRLVSGNALTRPVL